MKRLLTLRLLPLAILCTVVLPTLVPAEALAQRKLVPLPCGNDPIGPIFCVDSMFVEEGTLTSADCEGFIGSGYSRSQYERHIYSNHHFLLVAAIGGMEHVDEFRKLTNHQSVLDSTNFHLLPIPLRTFLSLFAETYGYDRVTARSASLIGSLNGSARYSYNVVIHNAGMYNLWKARQLYAASHGIDTTDDTSIMSSWMSGEYSQDGLYLPHCLELATGASDAAQLHAASSSFVCTNAIRIPESNGQYTLVDVSGRVIAMGGGQQGDIPKTIPVQPGVYMLVTSTKVYRYLVVP